MPEPRHPSLVLEDLATVGDELARAATVIQPHDARIAEGNRRMAAVIREGVELAERLQRERDQVVELLRNQTKLAEDLASTATAYLKSEADAADLADACGAFARACRRST